MKFLSKLFAAAAKVEQLPIEALVGETLPCFTDPDAPAPVDTYVESIEVCAYKHLLLVNAETNPVFVETLLAMARLHGEPDPSADARAAFKEMASSLEMKSKVEERAEKTPGWMKKRLEKRAKRLMKRRKFDA